MNGGWDEVKTVKEGDALTLHAGATHINKDSEMRLFFKSGSLTIRIAQMNNRKVT